MKRLFVLSLLAFSVAAVAQQTVPHGVTTTQNLTGSAPTLSTEGMELGSAIGYTVVVSANAAQTITGGSLLCYYYGCVAWTAGNRLCTTKRWLRCPTSLDFTPGTGVRDAASGDFETPTGYGKIHYVPSSVTVSGGTTVDVTIVARERP